MFNNEFDDHNFGTDFNDLISRYESIVGSETITFFEEEEFEWIIEYYETQNELDRALEAANYAHKQYPFSELFLVKQAGIYFDQRKPGKALELLDRAEILDSSDIDIYLLRAEIYTYQGKFKKSISILKEALNISDKEDLEEVYLSMAEVYEAWEKFELVFQTLKKVLELNPLHEDALGRIWYCVDVTEKYGESVELHNALINRDPYNYLAWYNLGQAYFGLSLYEKAAEAFEYVTLIQEDFEMAYRDWGQCLVHLDRPDDAITVYEDALQLADPYEEIYFGLGMCYEMKGLHSKARFNYRKALQLDPYYDEAWYRIGENFRAEDNPAEALNAFKKALRMAEDNVDYLMAFATTAHRVGHTEDAIANYHKVLSLQPNNTDHWIMLSRLQFESGDVDAALATVDNALEHFGEMAMLRYLFSVYCLSGGRKSQGLATLQEALELDYALHTLVFTWYPPLADDQDVCDLIDRYKP